MSDQHRGQLIPVVLLSVSANAIAADAASPDDFAYSMKVLEGGEAAAYRITLPLAVYRKAVSEDLADVRIFNAHGEVVPYAIERPSTEVTGGQQPARILAVFPLQDDSSATLDAVRITIESGKAAVNLQTQAPAAVPARTNSYIVDGRSTDAAISALVLDWPGDAAEFAGRLKIEAGENLSNWHTVVAAAPIANLRAGDEHLIERRAEIPETKAKFWRISWVGPAAPFVLTAVAAEPARGHMEVQRAMLTVPGAALGVNRGEFSFDLGGRLPVDRVNVELPEANTIAQIELLARANPADAWQPVLRSGFYRLKDGGEELRNAAVAVPTASRQYWLLRASPRGGGLGSGIPQLNVGWVPHQVTFLARGAGPFELAYGSATAEPAETSLATIPKNVSIRTASLGPPVVRGGDTRRVPPPGAVPWKAGVLWAVLIAGVGLLGWMAFRLSKDLGHKPA